jgi:hypothetical protein
MHGDVIEAFRSIFDGKADFLACNSMPDGQIEPMTHVRFICLRDISMFWTNMNKKYGIQTNAYRRLCSSLARLIICLKLHHWCALLWIWGRLVARSAVDCGRSTLAAMAICGLAWRAFGGRLCLLYFFPWQFSGVSHYRLSMRLVHRVRVGSWVAHAWVGSGLRALLFVFCLWLELGIVLFCWLLIVFCDLPTTVWGTPGHLHVRVTTHPTV